jgi:tripartite-type tricarboxylate transporter receptor subunit TctC
VVAKLAEATNAALASPDVLARLADEGALPTPMAPDVFRAFVAAELERWGEVARRNNLKPNE